MDESGDFWRSVTTEMAVSHNKCEPTPPTAFQSVLAVTAAVMQRGTPQKKKSLTGKSGKAQPVPPTGIEPVRCFHRGILSPLRLPVPPPRQVTLKKYGGGTQNRTGDKGFADLCLTAWLCRHMERKTGLEPATPTLARLCSTTELLPHAHLQQ